MPIVITPESDMGKEMAKWEKPYKYEPFPKMLYQARQRPDGKVSVAEADDKLFGGQPGSAEMFSTSCQTIVKDEVEMQRYREMGWRESPQEALDFYETKAQGIGNAAASRAHEDRNMGEKARAEARAVEGSTSEHVPVIPEAKVSPRRKVVTPARRKRA